MVRKLRLPAHYGKTFFELTGLQEWSFLSSGHLVIVRQASIITEFLISTIEISFSLWCGCICFSIVGFCGSDVLFEIRIHLRWTSPLSFSSYFRRQY
jgi:hypothetical protein